VTRVPPSLSLSLSLIGGSRAARSTPEMTRWLSALVFNIQPSQNRTRRTRSAFISLSTRRTRQTPVNADAARIARSSCAFLCVLPCAASWFSYPLVHVGDVCFSVPARAFCTGNGVLYRRRIAPLPRALRRFPPALHFSTLQAEIIYCSRGICSLDIISAKSSERFRSDND